MDNKKGLGRGLGSLLGIFDEKDEDIEIKKDAKGKIEEINGERVVDIDIKLIDVNPNQPRKNFDPTALKELADSIKVHGVIQPIIVNKNGDRYIIVAGERRFRASKMAGLKVIPAIVKDYSEQQIKEISLLENIQREDLNPVEVANAMRELLEIYGWTQDVLADRLGKSRPAIANTLRLLTLQPEVLALIESGKLSAGHARSLVVVSDPATQVKLAKLAVTKKVTVRDLEKAVKQLNNPQAKKVKVEPSPELKELINLMQHKFATKVSVMGNDKKGRIYIDYYSSDDLDRILDFLSK
ncbi:MAG TPA: chromosome partitioning protein ParB [Clostridiales bacterium]|nr:chromosome partitioning protein ParB [Clostridiales bacterium]